MAQTLRVKQYGGTVTFSATSDPAGPTLTYSNAGTTWGPRNNNVITVAANNEAGDRSFDISVTATTITSESYDGIASAYSAYTITQDGTGTTPGKTIQFEFASTQDFGDFTMAVSGSGVYDEQTTDGISDTGDLGSSSIPAGASIYLGVKNETSNTRQIAIDYTTSSPSYSFTSVSAGSWKWMNVTQADGKTFYIQIQ